jgi:hypothetical protein
MAMDPDGIIPEHTQPTQHQRKPTNSSYAHAEILQTLPIDPSPSCLEWSNDGQAYVITKANVYLLVRLSLTNKRRMAPLSSRLYNFRRLTRRPFSDTWFPRKTLTRTNKRDPTRMASTGKTIHLRLRSLILQAPKKSANRPLAQLPISLKCHSS